MIMIMIMIMIIMMMIIIIIIIKNFCKSLLQLYRVFKIVLSRSTTFYLTTHENASFLTCGEVV